MLELISWQLKFRLFCSTISHCQANHIGALLDQVIKSFHSVNAFISIPKSFTLKGSGFRGM